MTKPRPMQLLTLALLAAGLSASPLLAQDKTFKVGVPLPLTGAEAKFGEMEKQAYEMAVDEINAKGGVKGTKLALDIQDSGGKPETATAIVEKFITIEKYPIVVGEYTSQCSYAVAGIAEKYKVPYLVVTGAADKITQQGWKYVYRLNPPSSLYNMGIFSFFEEVAKPKSIALLYENTDFGTSTSKAMKEYADAKGIQVLLYEGYSAGAVDFKPILQKVKSLRPDVIYMVSYLMDASMLMRQSKELDINPQAFIGGAAGFTLPEFLQNAARRLRVRHVGHALDSAGEVPGREGVLRQLQEEIQQGARLPWRRGVRRGLRPRRYAEAGEVLDSRRPARRAGRDQHDDRLRPGEVRLLGSVHEPEQDGHARPPGPEEEVRDDLAERGRLSEVRLSGPELARPQVGP